MHPNAAVQARAFGASLWSGLLFDGCKRVTKWNRGDLVLIFILYVSGPRSCELNDGDFVGFESLRQLTKTIYVFGCRVFEQTYSARTVVMTTARQHLRHWKVTFKPMQRFRIQLRLIG